MRNMIKADIERHKASRFNRTFQRWADAPENDRPFYERGKIRPDKAAIANLHKLQENRPLKPPGRAS